LDLFDLVSSLHLGGPLTRLNEMSSDLKVADNDAEKGMLEVRPDLKSLPTLPAYPNEKNGGLIVSPAKPVYVDPAAQVVQVAPVKKAPAKPKRKVSKWVRWKIWFNTYRSDLIIIFYQ
jgi:hypothetical protein